jgi:hypothetical protein
VSRLSVAVAVVVGTILALLLLIALEAKLTLAGERRLAAGANGLAVLAAVGLVVELTVLASRAWAGWDELRGRVGSRAPAAAGGMIDAEEPRVSAEDTAPRS